MNSLAAAERSKMTRSLHFLHKRTIYQWRPSPDLGFGEEKKQRPGQSRRRLWSWQRTEQSHFHPSTPPLPARRTSALAALLSTVDGLDTPLEVDTKIANALLGLATKTFVTAQLASWDASISALQGGKADTTLLASYATNAALSACETTLQSALDAILAELAALQLSAAELLTRRPGRSSQLGSLFAEATSFTTCIWRLLSSLRWPTATTR